MLITCPDCGRQISDAAPTCLGCGRASQASAPAPSQHYAAEQTILEDRALVVTNKRVIVSASNVTYSMANVTSVKTFTEPRPAGFIVAGFMVGALGLLCVGVKVAESAGVVEMLVGAALSGSYFLTKPKYWVRIGTAGAESNAVWSNDPAWTQTAVAAINNAMVARG